MKMGNQDGEKAGVSCCFCDEDIIITDIDPCDITIMANWISPHRTKRRDQFFWCHLECFRSKMHDGVKPYLMLDLLSEREE
jgi:hypothetical protein